MGGQCFSNSLRIELKYHVRVYFSYQTKKCRILKFQKYNHVKSFRIWHFKYHEHSSDKILLLNTWRHRMTIARVAEVIFFRGCIGWRWRRLQLRTAVRVWLALRAVVIEPAAVGSLGRRTAARAPELRCLGSASASGRELSEAALWAARAADTLACDRCD